MEVVEGVATIEDVDTFVADLREIEESYGATVQAFDGRYVVGRTHLERAVELAERAAERGETIARDQSVEILLYAAGRRQINRAFEMGVSEGECPVVAIAVGGDETGAARALSDLLASSETAAVTDESTGTPDTNESAGTPGTDESAGTPGTDESTGILDTFDEARVREFFDVTERELTAADASLEDLVCERVALLVVER